MLCIELVEVMNDARIDDALIAVDLVIEACARNGTTVEHEVRAHPPARVGETVGKLLRRGVEQQARSLCTVCAENDCLGALKMFAAS